MDCTFGGNRPVGVAAIHGDVTKFYGCLNLSSHPTRVGLIHAICTIVMDDEIPGLVTWNLDQHPRASVIDCFKVQIANIIKQILPLTIPEPTVSKRFQLILHLLGQPGYDVLGFVRALFACGRR